MLISNSQSKYHRPIDGTEVRRRAMRPTHFPLQVLPHRVDLRQWMTPIVNQKDMKTCTANAFASACEYLIKRNTGHYVPISRLFIYFNGQIIDQRTYSVEDGGASRRNVVLGIRKFGICTEEFWPYDKHLLNKKPSDDAYETARQYTVVPLKIPVDITVIKTCLANQIPIIVGIKMTKGTNREAKANGGYISIPDQNDTTIAKQKLHVVLLVGYDEETQHFIVRNSWGPDWGYHGYFYIPYEYLLDKRLVSHTNSLWAITDILRRQDHLPTVRQLVMPRYRYDSRCQQTRDKRPPSIRPTIGKYFKRRKL